MTFEELLSYDPSPENRILIECKDNPFTPDETLEVFKVKGLPDNLRALAYNKNGTLIELDEYMIKDYTFLRIKQNKKPCPQPLNLTPSKLPEIKYEASIDELRAHKDSALDVQVGGDHYKDMAIQPIEFTMKNNLNFCQGNIVKYVTRYKHKNGIEDLKKAKHYIDLLIESEYGKDNE